MNLERQLRLYTSYSGRISQEQFWWAFLWITIPVMAVEGIVSVILYYQMDPTVLLSIDPRNDSYDADIARLLESVRWALYVQLALLVVSFVPLTAISVKRRHDRGARGISVWVYAAATLLVYAGFMTIDPTLEGGAALGPLGFMPFLAIPVVMALSVYLLVTLGILEGNEGPNRYGPAPTARVATPRV